MYRTVHFSAPTAAATSTEAPAVLELALTVEAAVSAPAGESLSGATSGCSSTFSAASLVIRLLLLSRRRHGRAGGTSAEAGGTSAEADVLLVIVLILLLLTALLLTALLLTYANDESGGEDEKEEGRIMLDAVRSTHSLAPDFVCSTRQAHVRAVPRLTMLPRLTSAHASTRLCA
jgi:hypothetical protein